MLNQLIEIEYRGLNIVDEISVVEIALNPNTHIVHLLDQNQVVEPEYDFSNNCYSISEGFLNMAKVLYSKNFFKEHEYIPYEDWVNRMTWVFYGSKQAILKLEKGQISQVIDKKKITKKEQSKELQLFPKYLSRIL